MSMSFIALSASLMTIYFNVLLISEVVEITASASDIYFEPDSENALRARLKGPVTLAISNKGNQSIVVTGLSLILSDDSSCILGTRSFMRARTFETFILKPSEVSLRKQEFEQDEATSQLELRTSKTVTACLDIDLVTSEGIERVEEAFGNWDLSETSVRNVFYGGYNEYGGSISFLKRSGFRFF